MLDGSRLMDRSSFSFSTSSSQVTGAPLPLPWPKSPNSPLLADKLSRSVKFGLMRMSSAAPLQSSLSSICSIGLCERIGGTFASIVCDTVTYAHLGLIFYQHPTLVYDFCFLIRFDLQQLWIPIAICCLGYDFFG